MSSVACLYGLSSVISSRMTFSCDDVSISGAFLLPDKILATIADNLLNLSNISRHEFHRVLTD